MKTRLIALLSLTLAAPAFAAEGTVAASGTVEIAAPAKVMRVRVELMGRGRDVKEALNKLQERHAVARKLFAGFDAAPDALTFTAPALSTEKTQRQQEMERMLGQLQKGRGARAEPTGKVQVPVFVVSTVKVDVPLRGTTADELLVSGHALQEKIRAADLGGVKDEDKKTPQEEELLEEMGGRELPDTGEPKRGEPTFVFVAAIPDSERDKALAEAFQRARGEATRLARAAGAGLGGVVTLAEATQPGIDGEDAAVANPRNYYQIAAARRDATGSEAVGVQPGRVVLRIVVNAQFALKPP